MKPNDLGRIADGDRAFVPTASSPSVSTVPASIPCAGSLFDLALEVIEANSVELDRRGFRAWAQANREMVRKLSIAQAMAARSDETRSGSAEGNSAGPQDIAHD